MAENGEWRKLMQAKRLQYQLEIQSRQIENVLTKHDISAHVAGGYVQPRFIRFDLASQMGYGLEKLRQIKNELLSALGATDGELLPHANGWELHISRKDNAPVTLLDLLTITPDLKPMTAILGLDEHGRPLCCELSDENLAHIYVTGIEGAGKTTLLRSVAMSLALSHKQSQLQLMVIDGSTEGNYQPSIRLDPLSYLPHMLCPVAYTAEEYRELLEFLAGECLYREEQQMHTPKIVLLIDEVVSLLQLDNGRRNFAQNITMLLQRGPATGLHLVLSTCQPASEKISNSMRLNLHLRLVGKMTDPSQAVAAAENSGTQAEYLLGQGDFLAVIDGNVTHFQSAFVSDYDMHLLLEYLHRHRPKPLLAQPVKLTQLTFPTEGSSDNNQVNTKAFTATETGIEFTG